MPNHIQNILKIKNIKSDKEKQEIIEAFTTLGEYNERVFDFNTIKPMPKRLHLIEGSLTNTAIKCALLKMPIERRNYFLDIMKKHLGFLDDMDHKKMKEAEEKFLKDKVENNYANIDYEGLGIETLEDLGIAYLNNIVDYGYPTWYDWSIENWGTKWNAYESFIKEGKSYLKFYFQTAWSTPMPIFDELSVLLSDKNIEIWYADEDIGHNCGKIYYSKGEKIVEYKEGDSSFANRVWRN